MPAIGSEPNTMRLEDSIVGKRLIVIGGVAAGMSAAAKAKRTQRDMEVVVCEKSSFISCEER